MKELLLKIYTEKGLNGLNWFLKNHKIEHERTVHDFGFGQSANAKKWDWIETQNKKPDVLAFHYYSVNVRARSNGLYFSKIRAIKFELK